MSRYWFVVATLLVLGLPGGAALAAGPTSATPAGPPPTSKPSDNASVAAPPAQAGRQTWDLAKDYSDTKNPAGAWTYGYKRGDGNFTPYTVILPADHPLSDKVPAWHVPQDTQTPNLWKNPRKYTVGSTEPGQVALHAGPNGEICIARWTAPVAGRYDFSAEFLPGDRALTQSYVWRGPKLLYQKLSENEPLTFKQADLLLTAGETLDFGVGAQDGHHYGTTPTIVTISLVSCLPPAPQVTRGTGADRLLLANGTTLTGTIQDEQYAITTSFARIDLPAAQVAGMVRAGGDRKPAQLLLLDGQVLVGELVAAIRLQTDSGDIQTVEPKDVQELGYRISTAKPADLTATAPLVGLRDGTRLLYERGDDKIQLETLGQTITLPAGTLLGILAVDGKPGQHRAFLANGSTLTGRLPGSLTWRPTLAPKLEVTRDTLGLLAWPKAPQAAKDAILVELATGDRLLGQLKGDLTLTTGAGSRMHRTVNLRSLKGNADGNLTVELWDRSTETGTLKAKTLTFDLGDGLLVNVRPQELAATHLGEAQPPAEWVQRVEERIRQLGSEKWAEREEATRILSNMPREIIPLLKKHEQDEDPEIRVRIGEILKNLEGGGERGPRR